MAVRIWVLVSTLLVADGWVLSALHALNRSGYLASFGFAFLLFVVLGRPHLVGVVRHFALIWHKYWRRLKRPAPLLFFFSFLLNLAGGIITRPDNCDTDAYRIPRVLHWLGAGGWHWIHTADSRMNIAGCGFEWLFAPQILFLGTDRWLFLINLISYALLPALVFAVFRRLGIAARVAWWWMWILPFGGCFVLQACSPINDSMAVIYGLAAVLFALRAGETGKPGELWLSLLAVGLLTGVKQTMLPLVLPWLVALWPARRVWFKQPVAGSLVLALGLLISAVPISCLNWKYAGSWSGIPKIPGANGLNWGNGQELTSPFWGLIGNAFAFPVQNLLPPFFPWAAAWNAAMHRFLQTPFGAHFTQFENFGYLDRSLTAADAGIGLSVVALALFSLGCAGSRRCPDGRHRPGGGWRWFMWLAPWISLLFFLSKDGTYQTARQAAAYYVLLFPLVLAGGGHVELVCRRWWQGIALASIVFTLAHLTFVRGREVLPISVVKNLQNTHPNSKFLSLFGDYYTAHESITEQRNFLQSSGLAGEKVVGYATGCGAVEPGLWLPFGSRRVERVLPGDSLSSLRAQGIHYIVVDNFVLGAAGQTITQWAAAYQADLVREMAFKINPGYPPIDLYLVHLRE